MEVKGSHGKRLVMDDNGNIISCDYCHAVGACPNCWGRAAIEELYKKLEEKNQALDQCIHAMGVVHDKLPNNHTRMFGDALNQARLAKGK